jgi:hypothetical protein
LKTPGACHPARNGDRRRSRHGTGSGERDQFDFPRIAWLESHGGAGRNVQAHPISGGAIEIKGTIDLKEWQWDPT